MAPKMLFLGVWFGLIVGNVIYQAFTSHDWQAAAERSFFQGSAVLACWLALLLAGLQ